VNIEKPVLTIMVGLPRSGKSTYVEKNKKELDMVLSADEFRYLVYNQKFWQEGEPLMWSIRDIAFKWLLNHKRNIIIDECNLNTSIRRKSITLAKEHGYFIRGIHVTTSCENCLARTGDEKLLEAIVRMNKHYSPIFEEEGFDEIIRIENN
jgi:predicted kinase